MRMKVRFSPFVNAVVFVAVFATLLGAQRSTPKRAIADKDIFDFVWVADPQLSPDGSQVAFTRVIVDEKRTGYETSIWMVTTSGHEPPVRLTNGKHDGQPRWSPDGKNLVFVRRGEKDETGKPAPSQLALLSLAGGEARVITDVPKGAGSPTWSPDGKRLAFLSSTTPEDIKKAATRRSPARKPTARASTSPTCTSSPAPSIAPMTKASSIPKSTSTSG